MSEPQATGERSSDGWVTVAEAATALGVSARTARRMAGHLSAEDRLPDTGHGRRVRLSAMAAQRGTATKAPDTSTVDRRTSTRSDRPDTVRDRPDMTASVAALRERLAVAETRAELLAAERDRLAAALEREQENTRAALARIEDSDARLASVLAATGRVQLSEAPDATGTDASPTRSNPEGVNAAETVEAPRPWWRWWGRG